MNRTKQNCWAACAGIVSSTASAQIASFNSIGDLPGGPIESAAKAVTDDGLAVGYSRSEQGYRSIRWTQQSGIFDLGASWAANCLAHDVSADGSVIVGWVTNAAGGSHEAFRWTEATGFMRLSTNALQVFPSDAMGVSADGNVIVGMGNWNNVSRAFRWTSSTGTRSLETVPSDSNDTLAFGVSSDGLTAVGSIETGPGQSAAFRWTESTGIVTIGDLPGGPVGAEARCASANGTTIAGYSSVELGLEAFRWNESTGMIGLGDFSGGLFSSRVNSMSDDGEILVGMTSNSSGTVAFIWNRFHGMRSISNTLQTIFGVNLAGWSLFTAWGVSPDGRVIAGAGYNPQGDLEGWVARIPRPCPGDCVRDFTVDLDDLTQLLSNFGLPSGAVHPNGDIDLDGDVDFYDLTEMLSEFGTICQ